MSMVKVAGNIVSQNGVTLFFSDGTSRVLPSDGFKTGAIIEAIMPSLVKGQPAEIDLDSFSIAGVIAKVTGGAVRVEEGNGQGLVIATATARIKDPNGALTQHLEDAAGGNASARGLKLFLAQFGKMSKQRKHSAEELLTFMKGADLPIADDGTLLGYKVLRWAENDVMVDKYSNTVRQKLGSIVFMPASKVSDNRRAACGVGLHIAAKSYLRGYYTYDSRLCLVKIRPGDVISVPTGERSKMRVCAYHIVKVLPKGESDQLVNDNVRIEELPESAQMLADAIAGNHTPIIQRVSIDGHGKLEITDLTKTRPARKRKPTRPLRSKSHKVTVKKVKDQVRKEATYDVKLARAQKDFDRGMSIRDIAKKHHMDRESLGKNLDRSRKAA